MLIGRRLSGLLIVIAALSPLGCRQAVPADARVAFDPTLVDRSPGVFLQSFDGRSSTLVLGTGWYGLDQTTTIGSLYGFSWASSSANAYFGMPPDKNVDLVARCAPFSFPRAPVQTMTVILNGGVISTIPVREDWQEIRLSLPADRLRRPLNEIELRFAYAQAPSRVTKSDDTRELSVLFDELAIVARGRRIPSAASTVGQPEQAGPSRKINLRADGLAIPLPAGERFRVRLGKARSVGEGLAASIQLAEASGSRTLWRGAPEKLSGLVLDFDSEGSDSAELLFRLSSANGAPAPADSSITFDLFPPDVLRAPTRKRKLPDIFLYLIDTFRADELGVYGSALGLTPRIDEFATRAVVYQRAWSAAPWTLPATTSILSGVYPFEHGEDDLGKTLPARGVPWLPEELSRLGYETAAFFQWPLGRPSGLERGFDSFCLDVRLSDKSRSSAARGLFWQYLVKRTHPDKPLFAYIHVSDPHAVYDPKGADRKLADDHPGTLPPAFYNPQVFMAEGLGPNAADTAHLRALYEGEIQYTDRQFGAFLDLLKYLGLYDESLIVLVADHGEEFFEHGSFDHGRTLYDELLHVPLIVKFPGVQQTAGRVSGRVSTLDIPATVLQLLGRPIGELRLHGEALPRLDIAARGGDREVFAQTNVRANQLQPPADLVGAAAGDITCILNRLGANRFREKVDPLEVYDTTVDPIEQSPLDKSDPRVQPCRDRLSRWLSRMAAAPRRSQTEEPLPPEEIRRLRALGYLR